MELSNIIIGVAAFFSTYYIKQLSDTIKEVTVSVKDLNSKVAVIVERTETHGHEIQVLRDKQDNLRSDVAHIKAHLGGKNENN